MAKPLFSHQTVLSQINSTFCLLENHALHLTTMVKTIVFMVFMKMHKNC